MGEKWDKGIPSSTIWAEVLRVLKPGAHLLAFGGTRTFHRLTSAIEDAGFEIRDCLMWLYGTGFPKSLDISKALDKAAGAERRVIGPNPYNNRRPNASTSDLFKNIGNKSNMTAPATDEAKRFSGYGTALKPAWEPCILAMKPVEGTFADNAMEHGVAGLNIDASRIGSDMVGWGGKPSSGYGGTLNKEEAPRAVEGRWPANLILDESFTQDYSRFFYCAKASTSERDAGLSSEPRRNNHPCVKPIELNRYLANLILPPPCKDAPRRLLVPFCGSGSEMIGGLLAGWDEVEGIEMQAEYVNIAHERIKHWTNAK